MMMMMHLQLTLYIIRCRLVDYTFMLFLKTISLFFEFILFTVIAANSILHSIAKVIKLEIVALLREQVLVVIRRRHAAQCAINIRG